ncbi:hypothetical protein [Erwinia mallotivora]|uniref:hypothetical protein n=1 Tax=Erwinia mallotivora TaxID=69222 RepID=UPI0021C01EF0|nr:hypothetical protein [Erwinia mallotivora]
MLSHRTHKILHRHGAESEMVRFLWSGLQMVGESSSATPERSMQYPVCSFTYVFSQVHLLLKLPHNA